MMTTLKFVLFWFGLAAFAAEASDKWDITKLDVSKLPPAAKKTGLTYANDVRPLLETSCLRCHGEDRPKADLRLDSLESVLKGGKDGKVVIPGNSKSSLLSSHPLPNTGRVVITGNPTDGWALVDWDGIRDFSY